jgi:hypothetical protein
MLQVIDTSQLELVEAFRDAPGVMFPSLQATEHRDGG